MVLLAFPLDVQVAEMHPAQDGFCLLHGLLQWQ
jgi:hypothetical protein